MMLKSVALLVITLAVVQAFDMRGLKKKNKEYLAHTNQQPFEAFNEEAYLLSQGKVSRRRLHSLGLEHTEENVKMAHRQLTYFNESRWTPPAPPWEDPAVGGETACPGLELYGSYGTSFICPVATQVDCTIDADRFAGGYDAGSAEAAPEGTWNVFPTAMRGNWDDPDYWTIPFPMGKVIGDYEAMCENGDTWNTNEHPACTPRGVDYPYATLCVFNRIYKLDYNALWYAWYAWSYYGDKAELITRSATIGTDGYASTTALYQTRIFVPKAASFEKRRSLLQETTAADPATSATAAADLGTTYVVADGTTDTAGNPVNNVLVSAAKGGDIETLQNMLDTTTLGASPSLVFPPPTPAAPWAPSGNNTNATAIV